jgi:hypothetical protein
MAAREPSPRRTAQRLVEIIEFTKHSSRCNFRLLQHNLPEADIARTTNGGLAAMNLNPAFGYATAFEFDFCVSSSS